MKKNNLLTQGMIAYFTFACVNSVWATGRAASNCGSVALLQVARLLTPGNNDLAALRDLPAPTNGFSMTELVNLSKHYKLNLIPVERIRGQQVPVPCLIHYKRGHYVAIIARKGNTFQVYDPAWDEVRSGDASTINREGSGYFLIPRNLWNNDWRHLAREETDKILGRGYSTVIDDSQDFYYATGQGSGLPTWRVSEPFISLWIQGEFLRYTSSAGKRIGFDIAFQQRNVGFNTNAWNFGPSWQCNWLSYIVYSEEKNEITFKWEIIDPPSLYAPLGGVRVYDLDGSPEYNTYSSIIHTTPSPNGSDWTVTYPDGRHCYYYYRSGPPSCGIACYYTNYLSSITDPQGRQINFNYTKTNGVVLLTSVVDYDYRTNLFIYSTNFNYPVSQIIDPYNRTNIFQYDAGGKLTNIINASSIGSSFAYDSQGVITNMVTPYGTTVFQYTVNTNTGNLVNRSMKVIEPDGRTHLFAYRDQSSYVNTNSTNVLIPFSFPTNQVPNTSPLTNTLDNTWMDGRDSFYWSPHCYSLLSTNFLQTGDFNNLTTNDYSLANLKHWLLKDNTSGRLGNTLSMQRSASPDGVVEGKKMWFDYGGKVGLVGTNQSGQTITNYFSNGTNAAPSLAAMVLPDGTTCFSYLQYNNWGRPTQTISTYSLNSAVATRTNTFSYASNGIDLVAAYGPSSELLVSNIYNSMHQVVTNYDALNQITRFIYNVNSQPISVVSPSGLTTTNIYYTSGLYSNFLETTTQLEISFTNSVSYTNGLIYTATNERGLTATNSYDNLLRLTTCSDPRGTIAYSYTNMNLLQTVDRLGNTNRDGYDPYGRLIWEADPLNRTNWYAYYGWGALKAVTNALGQVNQTIYDNLDRTLSTIAADGFGSTNNYDLVGQLVSTSDALGVSMTNYYNNQGLIYAASNAFGQVAYMQFDIRDRITNIVDANGITNFVTYDALDRVLSITYPAIGNNETFGYDSHGLIGYTNQLGKIMRYAYDVAARNIATTNANGEVTQFKYDVSNNLTNLIDGRLQNTYWVYDQFGRATNKLDATGASILAMAYDANDRQTNRWSAAKGNTKYLYDAANNLTNVIYPVSPAIILSYNALNQVTNMVDSIGTTVFQYTSFGGLQSEDGPWDADTVSFAYQNNHLVKSLTLSMPNDSPRQENYGLDNANRLATLSAPEGSYSYSYKNPGSLVQKVVLPKGAYVTNTYDNLARLTATLLKNSTDSTLNSHTYAYNQASWPTNQVRNDGSYVNYVYDGIGQLSGVTGYETNGLQRPHENLGYAYDAANNLSVRTNNALVQTFNANNLNELTTITRTGTLTVAGTTSSAATNVTVNGSAASRYGDNTFALAGFTVTNGNNTFTAIAQDSYNRKDTNSVTFNLPATNNYIYDLNGNLTSDGTRGFDYDDENQLIRITATNAWKSEFVYDGLGRRRLRTEYIYQGGGWQSVSVTRFVYCGSVVLEERDGNNIPQTSYTRGSEFGGGIGGLLARTDHGSQSHAYYHSDATGNVTAMIDDSQAVVARYLYDPYGNTLAASGSLAQANTYRYASKELHLVSGIIYYGLRYYSPDLMRFINKDPIGEPGGVNLYGYALNNPTSYIDFWGLSVGQPGFWTGFIPIYGSGRAAIDDFQNGHYVWGTVNGALAITDVFLLKSLATAAGKGLWKFGSHSWSATSKWATQNGWREFSGQPIHHWAIPQNGWGKTMPNWLKNQPWNFMPINPPKGISPRIWHDMIEGKGRGAFGFSGRMWYGTPSSAKAVVTDVGGKLINGERGTLPNPGPGNGVGSPFSGVPNQGQGITSLSPFVNNPFSDGVFNSVGGPGTEQLDSDITRLPTTIVYPNGWTYTDWSSASPSDRPINANDWEFWPEIPSLIDEINQEIGGGVVEGGGATGARLIHFY